LILEAGRQGDASGRSDNSENEDEEDAEEHSVDAVHDEQDKASLQFGPSLFSQPVKSTARPARTKQLGVLAADMSEKFGVRRR